MRVNRLYLKNFRRFDEASFEFSPGNTLIFGPNAIGKTTILEAIHLLIFGRSFRASALSEIIREGETTAAIQATFTNEGIEHTLGFYFTKDQKKITLNRKSLSSVIGLLLGVTLLPSDINLIMGQPPLRRLFLDYLIAQVDPLYLHHLSRYGAVLKNRNALLKRRDFRTIDVYEEEMAKSASYIALARQKAVSDLNCLIRAQEDLSLTYMGNGDPFLETYQKNRAREAHMGFTISGPQKDDVGLFLNGKESKLFSSEGQKRNFACALKIAAWEYLKQSSGKDPILLVDDAGLGFDQKRKASFMESLEQRGQVLITSAEEFTRPLSCCQMVLS